MIELTKVLNIKINSTPSYRQVIKIVDDLSILKSNLLISKKLENRFVNGKSLFGLSSLNIFTQDELEVVIINNNENQLHKDVEYIKALFSRL